MNREVNRDQMMLQNNIDILNQTPDSSNNMLPDVDMIQCNFSQQRIKLDDILESIKNLKNKI